MGKILAKRVALHRQLKSQSQENLVLQDQLDKLEHLASLGMVTAMIAHEINNIMTPMLNYAHLAIENPQNPNFTQKALTKTRDNTLKASKIMNSILSMAKGKSQEKSFNKVHELVASAFDCIGRELGKDGINVKLDIPDHLDMYCDPVGIQQVLMNLILNARDVMLTRGGILTISACGELESVWIKVKDSGSGIKKENLANIFEPFFTTKQKKPGISNSGTGLGLAFCKKIIEAHDGVISAKSSPNQGTQFKIIIPNKE